MKVCHISTSDIGGGAARAAYRLHDGLRRQGHQSTMFVGRRDSQDPDVKSYQSGVGMSRLIARVAYSAGNRLKMIPYRKSRPSGYEAFSDERAPAGAKLISQLPTCDVLNLHWVANFVDYAAVLEPLAARHPLVWTLHDMNPFTGGCHYDHECGRFTEMCGACPQLGSRRAEDRSRRVWQRKAAVFSRIPTIRLHIVSPSKWLADAVKASSLLARFPVTIIPNGVDTLVLQPRCSKELRQVLEIGEDQRVVLFAAQSTTNRRKGFDLLIQALTGFAQTHNIVLVSIGSGIPQIPADLPHHHLGSIENDHLLSTVYSLADLFVIPSLQDNLPNTVLEAMACGVPVVGFDVGGIPDMVRPGETGLLAPVGDVQSLRSAIEALLNDSVQRTQMSATCRRVVVEEYALDVQARRYVTLYESMLKADSGV